MWSDALSEISQSSEFAKLDLNLLDVNISLYVNVYVYTYRQIDYRAEFL